MISAKPFTLEVQLPDRPTTQSFVGYLFENGEVFFPLTPEVNALIKSIGSSGSFSHELVTDLREHEKTVEISREKLKEMLDEFSQVYGNKSLQNLYPLVSQI